MPSPAPSRYDYLMAERKANKLVSSGKGSFEAVEWSEVHAKNIISRLGNNIFPWLGSRPVDEITAPEIIEVFRMIEYYQAIQESTQKTDSAPFISFMLRMIRDTVTSSTPEVAPEVTPEVRLLSVLAGEMTRHGGG